MLPNTYQIPSIMLTRAREQQNRESGKSVEKEATRYDSVRSELEAVTQPKDPSLGADTQLTTGYIPSARRRRTRGRKGEKKRWERAWSGQKGSDSQSGPSRSCSVPAR